MCSPGWSSPPRSTRRPMRSSCRSAPVATRPHARSDLRRKGLRLSLKPWNVQRATGCILAYVCGPPSAGGTSTVTPFGTIELTVYPYECDAFGHLNQAALLTLLERARWDALARGPGMDLFDRNGVWPAVRKATIEYRAAAFARDVLRVETTLVGRGTTSMTLRHVVRRVSDDAVVADAEMVFVCIRHHGIVRSEEHTSELQSRLHLVCRLLLEKKKKRKNKVEVISERRIMCE